MTVARCPLCSRETADRTHAPFCGDRCRTDDLWRWLNGAYRLPTEESSMNQDEGGADRDPDYR
ncbi:MAG: DNA gyrase inhibitor YacG [Nitrospiria bacterium]